MVRPIESGHKGKIAKPKPPRRPRGEVQRDNSLENAIKQYQKDNGYGQTKPPQTVAPVTTIYKAPKKMNAESFFWTPVSQTKQNRPKHRGPILHGKGESSHNPTPVSNGITGGNGPGSSTQVSTRGRDSVVGGKAGPKAVGGGGTRGGRKGGRGGRGGGKGGGNLGFGGKGIRNQAETIIDRDIKLALRQLMDERGDLRADMKFSNNQARDLYNRSAGDVRHVFGEAAEANTMNTQAIMDRLSAAQSASQQLYGNLVNQQETTTDANRAEAIAEMQRLGVQGGANLGQMEADANFANLQANTLGANNVANLQAMGNSAGNIGNLIGQMAASSQASHTGRLMNTRNAEIAASRQNFREDSDDVLDAMRTERLSRGNRVQELYQQMEAQAYDRWFQNRQANRSHSLAQSNFNLGVSKFNADQMWQQAALLQEERAAAAEARNNKRALRNSSPAGTGPARGKLTADSFFWNS